MFSDTSLAEAYKYAKGGVQMATHLFQAKLLKGLDREDIDLTVYNVPPVGSFPISYKKLTIKEHTWGKNLQLGYLNIPFVKHAIQTRKLNKLVDKWIMDGEGEKSYIIAYSLYEPFLKVLDRVKSRYADLVHVCLLHTDAVPGRNSMYVNPKAIKLGDRLVSYTRQYDSFVILSEHLKDVLEINNRPYVITECICDDTQIASTVKSKSDNIFLYTGTTAEIYGIKNMVDAFIKVPEAQLWICGAGDSDDYIRDMATIYPNIKHYGYVGQDVVKRLRDECDFLINPRMPTGTYTKYSFPSKTAEYLASSKPVVMYKLEGIADEYDDYINYIDAIDPDGIERQIRSLINMDYSVLVEKGNSAREFMLTNKTAQAQANKILDMLSR